MHIRKKISLLMTLFILFSNMFILAACKKKTKDNIDYKVLKEDFFFSTDNGKHYGNGRVAYPVGKSLYMKVTVVIETSDGEAHDVKGHLSIPKIQAIDSHFLKGQIINPEEDEDKGITTYPFEITTNEEWTFLFEFIPNEVGTIKMKLEFDDSIAKKYDMTNTIKIVKEDELDAYDDDDEEDDDKDNDVDETTKSYFSFAFGTNSLQ